MIHKKGWCALVFTFAELITWNVENYNTVWNANNACECTILQIDISIRKLYVLVSNLRTSPLGKYSFQLCIKMKGIQVSNSSYLLWMYIYFLYYYFSNVIDALHDFQRKCFVYEQILLLWVRCYQWKEHLRYPLYVKSLCNSIYVKLYVQNL